MSAIIAYDNLVDTATFSGAGVVVAGFPLANSQTRQLSKTARIQASGTPEIIIDFGAAKLVRLVSIIGCNVDFKQTNSTTVSYRAGTSGAWVSAPVTWPTNEKWTDATVAKNIPPALHCALQVATPIRQVRIQCGWARAAGAAYYEFGRLWASDAIVLPEGVDGGWSIGFEDAGKVDISSGLQAYESQRPRPRTLRVSLGGKQLTSKTAFGFDEDSGATYDTAYLQDMQMMAGTTGEIIVLPRTSSERWVRRIGVYGHLAQTFDILHSSGPYYSAELAVIEER